MQVRASANHSDIGRPSILESRADKELESRVKNSIAQNKNLAASAKAVEIVAHNGSLTLRGTVYNELDMAEIVVRAKRIAGADKVQNELDVLN